MRRIIIITILIITTFLSLMSSCSKEEDIVSQGVLTIEKYVPEPTPPEFVPGEFEDLRFIPPALGEKIVVEEKGISDPDTNKILIFKESESTKELLFTIKPKTNFFYIRENKGNIYFTIEDNDLNNGLNYLWMIDVMEGTITNSGIKIGGNYKFTLDGNYICYVYNDYGKYFDMYTPANWAFIPVVKLLNIESGEETKYDFENSFLNGEWGAIVDIEPTMDRINLEFSMDGGTLGKGYILLSDKVFYKTN